jgi:hypothetical protein
VSDLVVSLLIVLGRIQPDLPLAAPSAGQAAEIDRTPADHNFSRCQHIDRRATRRSQCLAGTKNNTDVLKTGGEAAPLLLFCSRANMVQ